jgi:hypothetical protein
VRRELARLECNAHRHTLHDLDPVAGGILGRQQRERRTGTETEPRDRAVVLDTPAVQVGLSCTSLKLASTRSRSSGTMAMSGPPGAMRSPSCTPRLAT